MSYSYVSYTGNGTVTQFSVPFEYISKDHVAVTVDGVSAPFTWFNATTVALATAPANGAVVKVKRTTPKNVSLVDFQDASTLTETALDLATKQNLLIAQEGDDKAEDITATAVAAAVGAAGATSRAVPVNTASDAGKVLQANVGSGGTYSWQSTQPIVDAAATAAAALYVPKAGGTMNGALTLSGNPTTALQAVTKQYVDGAAGRTATGTPMIPAAGQWNVISLAANTAAVLPAGGTWAYFLILITNSTGATNGNNTAGIAAGGTTIGNASVGNGWIGFCWKIA